MVSTELSKSSGLGSKPGGATKGMVMEKEMQNVLKEIDRICEIIDNDQLNNEQFYLDWLDELNKRSVRD